MSGRAVIRVAGWLGLAFLLLASGCATSGHRPAPSIGHQAGLGEASVRLPDGKELPYSRWVPSGGEPRVVVIGVHGLSGASSDFRPLGEHLEGRRMAVYATDLRGQGNDPDPRMRGDIASRQVWIDDLRDFHRLVAERHDGAEIVWFGESLGAVLALEAAAGADGEAGGRGSRPAGLVLAAPPVALREGVVPAWKVPLLRLATRVLPWAKVSFSEIAGAEAVEQIHVTRDTTHASQMAVTPHHVEHFTLRLLGEADRLARASWRNAERVRDIPVLVLYTSNDAFTAPGDVERFVGAFRVRDITGVHFPASHHLILHDVERERALRVIGSWLGPRFFGGGGK